MGYEILIPQEIHDKVMHWVNKSSNEVSGFGKATLTENVFEIKSVHLLDQEVGGAHTDIDEKAMAKFMYESRNDAGEYLWWWHSHVNMAVFWSSQDKDTILELGGQGCVIASVFNKSEEVRSAIAYKYSYKSEISEGTATQFTDELTTTIGMNVDESEVAKWDKEFADKVKEKKVIPYTSTWDDHWEYGMYEGVRPALHASPIYDNDPGLKGYGIRAEAEALGMSAYAYWLAMERGTIKDIIEMEDKLEELVKQGKVKGEPYANLRA